MILNFYLLSFDIIQIKQDIPKSSPYWIRHSFVDTINHFFSVFCLKRIANIQLLQWFHMNIRYRYYNPDLWIIYRYTFVPKYFFTFSELIISAHFWALLTSTWICFRSRSDRDLESGSLSSLKNMNGYIMRGNCNSAEQEKRALCRDFYLILTVWIPICLVYGRLQVLDLPSHQF